MKLSRWRKVSLILLLIILCGYVIPDEPIIPVHGANKTDWNRNSFWYEPWGASGVHKGIDIFAKKGTRLNAAEKGVVLYVGELSRGGNVILILGPKWKIHYYAHLETTTVSWLGYYAQGERIGSVGDSGNAKGKPPHLHYSIVSLVPRIWRVDGDNQGWKKMFFLDPDEQLSSK